MVTCGMVAGVMGLTCTARAQNREQQVQKAIELLRQAKYQQSLNDVDALLAATPDDCRLLSLRGMALSGVQKPDEAVESYEKALRSCPDDLLALEGAAQIEYARRKPDAVDLVQRILQLRPKDVTAHAMLASMYRAKEECKQALPHFEASAQMFPYRPTYQQAYAYCLADTGHYKQAATNYEDVLEKAPDETARFNLAFVEWKLHDSKSALETLKPLLNDPEQESVITLGARLAEDTGDTPLAVKLLREAIAKQPKNLTNYLQFAQIAFNHHSAQVGIDMVDAGLTQLPKSAQLYLARGVLEVQISKLDAAIVDFKKAHELAPQLSLAMDAMGIMESQQYQQTAALELYRREAKLHPRDSLLQYLYAEALSESGSEAGTTTEAIAAAEKSISLEPNYAPARDLLALLYLRVKDAKGALDEAQAALKIQPTDDVALYHEMMAYRRLGQEAKVHELVKKLAVMRRAKAQQQKADHRYVLQDEVAH